MSAVTMGSPFLSAADEKGNIALTVLSANQPRFKREKQVWGNDREVMCREPSQVGAPLLIHCLDTRIKKAMGETPPVKSQQVSVGTTVRGKQRLLGSPSEDVCLL